MMFFILIIKTFYRDISIKGLEDLPPSGPLIFTQNFSSRAGIESVIILFVIGGILLYRVDEHQGRIAANTL
jgi:1-acyl-sn-glycerol-3-phosphate acyltransferase